MNQTNKTSDKLTVSCQLRLRAFRVQKLTWILEKSGSSEVETKTFRGTHVQINDAEKWNRSKRALNSLWPRLQQREHTERSNMTKQHLPYIVSQFDIEQETTESTVQPVCYRHQDATHVFLSSEINLGF